MKTVNIKGKEYVEVSERVKFFRENYNGYAIKNTMLSNENGMCVFKSEIFDENKNIVSSGHAYETEGSSYINKTSYVENCETSAVGRALGFLGIGIDTSIASANEVKIATDKKKLPQKKEEKPEEIIPWTDENKMHLYGLCKEKYDMSAEDTDRLVTHTCNVKSQTVVTKEFYENIVANIDACYQSYIKARF